MWLLISATNFCTDIVKSSPHTSAGPSGARRRRIPSSATSCGRCVGCNGSRIPSRRSCSRPSAARPSLRQGLPACWRALARPPGLASRFTHTCCGTPVATPWRIKVTIRGRCRPIWATATSSTRRATPSCRRVGSRTSGGDHGQIDPRPLFGRYGVESGHHRLVKHFRLWPSRTSVGILCCSSEIGFTPINALV